MRTRRFFDIWCVVILLYYHAILLCCEVVDGNISVTLWCLLYYIPRCEGIGSVRPKALARTYYKKKVETTGGTDHERVQVDRRIYHVYVTMEVHFLKWHLKGTGKIKFAHDTWNSAWWWRWHNASNAHTCAFSDCTSHTRTSHSLTNFLHTTAFQS